MAISVTTVFGLGAKEATDLTDVLAEVRRHAAATRTGWRRGMPILLVAIRVPGTDDEFGEPGVTIGRLVRGGTMLHADLTLPRSARTRDTAREFLTGAFDRTAALVRERVSRTGSDWPLGAVEAELAGLLPHG
ncbi:hypothetical protein EV193_105269 [Herbihabitans rhizosphaerae]|uniref:Uncharacterized protein n=1 Tax=Herbihabitans rhizosphaerae TaxID=1872711 RepID=A0A4Q7KPT7_9PSEU|nr:hypothetical protein [Herbihabitans rhizosphaerae]RZS37711.1 hypothetical protein EV193_105269 [Herbihabitans rhizosphaerae]